MIKRLLERTIAQDWFIGKTVVLLGARQVGKTTLLRQLSESIPESRDIIWINADNADDKELLQNLNSSRAKALFPSGTVLFIDEAQRLENAGLTLKIIHDNCKDIQVVATGSSSFELTDKIRESLTGRKWTYTLFPISIEELVAHQNGVEVLRNLDIRLIYGSYPDVINNKGKEEKTLLELASDYLYKDVFNLTGIRKPDALEKLVQAIAFQIGSEVSYQELSNITGLDKGTVQKYMWLLEESFIIFRLPSFARNLRNELSKRRKVYFYDVGIRNALIHNFKPLTLRTDTGHLWENFLITERIKRNTYHGIVHNPYFWRTKQQQEIDYIEEIDSELFAYEFKYSPKKKVRFSKTFTNAYPNAHIKYIHKDNFFDFVL